MPSIRKALGALALAGVALAAINAAARSGIRRREDIDLENAGAPGRYLDIGGQRVHYVDIGSGPALMLIHGWNGSTFSMRRTIPELSGQYRVIAVDLPGYGFSSRTAPDYSTKAQAAVVSALMDHLGIQQAAVLGHSMGGGVAMRLSLDKPQRIDRLILVSSVTPREIRQARFGFLFRPLMPLIGAALVRRSMIERALRRVVHDPALVTPEMVDGYFRPLRVKGHLRSQMAALNARRAEPPYDPAQITQPVLLLWGEHDRVIPPSTGLALAEQLPNARVALIRAAAHLALEEQPAECNRLIRQFLDQPLEEGPAPSSNGVSSERTSTVS